MNKSELMRGRVDSASAILRNWSSHYNPCTQQGDAVRLVELITKAYKELNGTGFVKWDYRLIRQNDGLLGIHEVYYDKAGNPVACTESPIDVTGEDKKEIRSILKKFDAAMKKPTLQTSIFEKTKSSMAMDRLAELDRELGL